MRKNNRYILAVSVITCLFNTNYALSEFEIEEVIVTAQKRAENSQDIPIAISAFSAEVIEKTRMQSLSDIAQSTPSFLVGEHSPDDVSDHGRCQQGGYDHILRRPTVDHCGQLL